MKKNNTVRMVLDTDTANEIDDQFALAYALCSPEALNVEAVYAAPFVRFGKSWLEHTTDPGTGMEQSYAEAKKVLRLMNREDVPVYYGSRKFITESRKPVESDAAYDIINRAFAEPEPLCVVAIGAVTNIASALLLKPSLKDHIKIVWLGGNALHWPDTKEYNMMEDVFASQTLLDSGVPLTILPALGAVSELRTTVPELERYIDGKNPICTYLTENVRSCLKNKYAGSRVIWDAACIAYLVNSSWTLEVTVHTPHLSDDCRYSLDTTRPFMHFVTQVDRDAIFSDMFSKLAGFEVKENKAQ